MTTKSISELGAVGTIAGTELVEVSQLSTVVRISATTISALASDNSYNDSANGFITATFAVGMRVNVAGFTGNVLNNILTGTITALTAGKMTIGGTDGDVIVDDAAGETVVISKWESKRMAANDLRPIEFITIALSDETTALVAGTNKAVFRMPYAFKLTEIPRLSVTTAPTGGTLLTADINKNTASILSTKLTINASEKTSKTAATPAVMSSDTFADDDEVEIDLDSVGSTIAGAGAKVTFIGRRIT